MALFVARCVSSIALRSAAESSRMVRQRSTVLGSRSFSGRPYFWRSESAVCVQLQESHHCRTYLLADLESSEAMIIDPIQENTSFYLSALAYNGFTLKYIVDTHSHADHFTAAPHLRHIASLQNSSDAQIAMSTFHPSPYVQVHLQDGDELQLGNTNVKTFGTPGHTPDSISLYSHSTGHVFTGDALLIGGTGRTDFAGGDPRDSYDSIVDKLFPLPDETVVLPAHDYRGHIASTIGDEKTSNPRVAGKTKEEYVNIMENLGLPLPAKIMEALQVNVGAVSERLAESAPLYTQLAEIRQMEPRQLKLCLDDPDILLLDVREGFELFGFADPHDLTPDKMSQLKENNLSEVPSSLPDIPDNLVCGNNGGVYIPCSELSQRVNELEKYKSKHIVTLCRGGVRSSTAAAILDGLGFKKVSNLKGGLSCY